MFFTNKEKSYVFLAFEAADKTTVDVYQFIATPTDSSAWKAVGGKKTFNTPDAKLNEIVVTSNTIAVLSTLNADQSTPVL